MIGARRNYRLVVGFLLLPLALYGVFVIAPYVQSFWISLTRWSGLSDPVFVGIENYQRLFADPVFYQALGHNLVILLVFPSVTILLGLVLSYLLNIDTARAGRRSRDGSRFADAYKIIYFFPQLLAVPIVAVLFQTILRPNESGLLNGILDWFGAGPVAFMADPRVALWCIIFVLIWQSVGFYVVMFSAAFAAIPDDVLEAAQLDGASQRQIMLRIALPMVSNVTRTAWVFLSVAAFDAFALVNVLSIGNGGPDGATTVLAVEIYKNAFTYSRFGYATAMGVALFIITLGLAAVVLRAGRQKGTQ